MDTSNSVRKINLTVRKENSKEDIANIYVQLFQDVNKDDLIHLQIQELKAGITNGIFKVYIKNDEDNSIVFGVFEMKVKKK